jgi:hypothetical protein
MSVSTHLLSALPHTSIICTSAFIDFYFLETGSRHVAQTDLELMIFLPQLPESWDYR